MQLARSYYLPDMQTISQSILLPYFTFKAVDLREIKCKPRKLLHDTTRFLGHQNLDTEPGYDAPKVSV